MLTNPNLVSSQNGEVAEDYEICNDYNVSARGINYINISLSKSKTEYNKIRVLIPKMSYANYNETQKWVPQQDKLIPANGLSGFSYLTIQESNYSGRLIFGNLINPVSPSQRKYYVQNETLQWLKEQNKLQLYNTVATSWSDGVSFHYAFIVLYYK